MSKLSPRAVRIVAAAKLLYGDTRWQSPLARLTGLSPALVQKIAAGADADRRAVTDDVYRRIAVALIAETQRQRRSAYKIEEIAGRMLAEL